MTSMRIFLLAVILSACSDSVEPQVRDTAPIQRQIQQSRGGHLTIDEQFQEIAKTEPNFGGFWMEGDRLIIATTDLSRSEAVRMNVAAFLSKQPSSHAARRISSRSMKYARYPVAKLLEWRSAAFRSVFRDNRVVMLDLDEANNRIYVGVSEPSAVQPTLTVLEQHSVPMTAVSVEVVGDVELMQNIQTQQIRPTIGGIQIDGSRSGDECTLGATVMWDIENTTYRFMTASHCSPSPGQVDGERRDSPVYPNALIGYEIQDPPVFWDSFGLQCQESGVATATLPCTNTVTV